MCGMRIKTKGKFRCPICRMWVYESILEKPPEWEFSRVFLAGRRGFKNFDKQSLQEIDRDRFAAFARALYRRCEEIMETLRRAAAIRGIDLSDEGWGDEGAEEGGGVATETIGPRD